MEPFTFLSHLDSILLAAGAEGCSGCPGKGRICPRDTQGAIKSPATLAFTAD